MKKLSLYVFLVLLWCSTGLTEILHLKCSYNYSETLSNYGGTMEGEKKNPPFEIVYSLDLTKGKMIGKDYKIWDDSGTYEVAVYDHKIFWIDYNMATEHQKKRFLQYFGQETTSLFSYTEINRYDGNTKMSLYINDFTGGKKLYANYVKKKAHEKADFEFLEKFIKLADKKQKEIILTQSTKGKCEKIHKFKKKF